METIEFFSLLLIACISVSMSNAANTPKEIGEIPTPFSVESCLNASIPLQINITDCDGIYPCTVQPNKDIIVIIVFYVDHNTTLLRHIVGVETNVGPITILDFETDVNMIGGKYYTVTQRITISEILSGQQIYFIHTIFDVINDYLVICVRVPLFVA